MKTIEIFEPAMCCSTGVCGPSVDPELLRISTLSAALAKQGIIIKRFNLTGDPQAFVANKVISEQLAKEGVEVLPVTLVDGVTAKTRTYPSNEEFSQWLGIKVNANEPAKKANSCCCGDKLCS